MSYERLLFDNYYMRSMSDSISKKGKRNTNITSLFFETTLTLAGVGDKTYIKLDNREDYISSRNIQEKTKHQRTEQKVSEKFSEQDSIIHQINLVYSDRFLSLKEIQLHKDCFLKALDSNKLRPYKALFKNDEYFTDAEIDMVNSCSKYRYASKNVLSLKSYHIVLLARDNIIYSINERNRPHQALLNQKL